MDPIAEIILEEYRENLPRFRETEADVTGRLSKALSEMGLRVAAVEARIKTELPFAANCW